MLLMRRALFPALLLLAIPALLRAQTSLNQNISGVVIDATGAALPNASITITEQGTGLTRSVTTNESGFYMVPNLPTGRYRVTCEAAGFKKEVSSDNELSTNVSIEVNFRLKVGDQTESITVQADAVVVESTTSEVGYTVTGEQASEIQLDGRNFPELLALLPGVSTTYQSGFSLFGGYGLNNSGQSINGGRGDSTTWNLNGADNKDNGGGGNNFVNINPDALAEFRVLTSNFSAESGTSSGAVVNLTVRSGTKNFHGRAYEYWRNDRLQALPFNALIKPKLRWNNFGWNLGGPVILPGSSFNRSREKLFFFVGQDIKILRIGSTTTWTVPTPLQKSGNFGSSTVRDPSTLIPFPNNIVPASFINPNARKLIDIYPDPNRGANQYVFNVTPPSRVHQYIIKIDYNKSEKDQFNFHWVHDYFRSLQNTTNLIQYYRLIPGLNSSMQWNRVIRPTLINVAQVTFTGNVIIEQRERLANPLFIKSFTRAGMGLTIPTIYSGAAEIPQVAVSGFTTLSVTPFAFNNFNRIFNWKDNLTKIIGKHTVKTGVLIMRSRKNQDNPPAINGQLTFNTSRSPTSGQALADALMGNFYQYTEAGGIREGWFRFTQVEPYIQDDWKAGRRLTLNLGLRWSYMQPQYSALNNTVQFLPQFFDPAKAATVSPVNGQVLAMPDPYNGLVIPGRGFPQTAKGRIQQYDDPAVRALFHDFPKGGAYTRWRNFAPRIGFAYDLTGSQKLVLRGGFGVAYERIQGNFIFGAINNTPFNPSITVLNGNIENPGAAVAGPASVQTINNSHYLDMKNPRQMTYSLGLQRKLGNRSMLTVNYVGSSASNLSYAENINQLRAGVGTSNYVPGSTTTLANTNSLRPYRGYGNIQQFVTGANFNYNSLQTQFRRQFPGAGVLNLAFTWGKGLTNASAYNTQPMDSYDRRRDWGRTSYNREKILVVSYVYPIPFWQHGRNTWYKKGFGGWQLSGVTQIQQGLPVNITISPDRAGTGAGNQRPDLVGDPYSGGIVGGYQILNPAAFALPERGTFGNLGAYNIFLPLWNNWNASVSKSFPTGEKMRWFVRIEMYNFPNHLSVYSINTGSYNGVRADGTSVAANWGYVSGMTSPRTVQVALRMTF
jgi:hypothetical protein